MRRAVSRVNDNFPAGTFKYSGVPKDVLYISFTVHNLIYRTYVNQYCAVWEN